MGAKTKAWLNMMDVTLTVAEAAGETVTDSSLSPKSALAQPLSFESVESEPPPQQQLRNERKKEVHLEVHESKRKWERELPAVGTEYERVDRFRDATKSNITIDTNNNNATTATGSSAIDSGATTPPPVTAKRASSREAVLSSAKRRMLQHPSTKEAQPTAQSTQETVAIAGETETAKTNTDSDDMVYVFGYGSLINMQSLRRTVGSDHDGSNDDNDVVVPCVVRGFRRAWRFRCKRREYTAVSLHPVDGVNITDLEVCAECANGVLVKVRRERLPLLDARECGYERTRIPPELVTTGVYGGRALTLACLQNTPIYAYTLPDDPALEIHSSSEKTPVPQSYLDCILHGALDLHPTFAHDFVRQTHGWDDVYWLNDRDAEDPVRRYVCDEKANEAPPPSNILQTIDDILKHHIPDAFQARVQVQL
ncbi:hypothetical protein HK100_001289 [Physocladia obscura]|uniref:Gamma-glutamylcyclotransferase n=1 Tax=Physocladia obscura TaxID=109957 RepID=A0AAD5SY57_9FUNG|nr:hypothetical protein HK100_001289 [Physocladia obscura]